MLARRPLCGDGSITVQVTGIQGSLSFAGITMRESTAAGSRKVQMMINGISNTLRREIRYTTGGQAFPSIVSSPASRTWLRLVRTGNMFRGYTSQDGITWWYVLQVQVPMNNCIEMGLILTNVQPQQTGTATYANVMTSGATTGPVMISNESHTSLDSGMAPELQVYPNPSMGMINLEMTNLLGQEVTVQVYDINGQLSLSRSVKEIGEPLMTIDLHELPKGVYLVRVTTPEGRLSTQRIVLQ
jgi:hypothetical protein